jgi:hypothetical protein
MGDIFVHTGLNRCFTQFFHWHFFPNLPNTIQFIKDDDPLSIAIHKLVRQEHSLTNERKKLINGLIEERMETGCDILIGASHGAFATISWNTLDHNSEFLLKTKILKEILPTAKILFINKDQIDYIISTWKCAFQQRNIMNICDFVVSKDEALNLKSSNKTEFIDAPYYNPRPWLYPYGLDFKKYIQTYYEYFGKENCCVVFFDELKNNLEMELAKILKFFTGFADYSIIEKVIASSTNASDFTTNRTASEGGLRLMGAAHRVLKYFNINLPYGEPYKQTKSKNSLIQKIYNRINWLSVRQIFQNRNNIVVKFADLFSKKTADQNRRVLLSKFPDLHMYYEKLNKL